jgi:hypothetical protein
MSTFYSSRSHFDLQSRHNPQQFKRFKHIFKQIYPEIKAMTDYEMRSAPRKRVKDADEQPLFLRKAYAMISSCPPEIGGWSEKGETFIVKDVKAFSDKIIPTVYKHNNFSSFVRQLNFYGFRKIKSESLSASPHWWEFRHASFIRGKPNLLSEIKRAVHYVTAQGDQESSKEIESLRHEISAMKERMEMMNETMHDLYETLNNLHSPVASPREGGPSKKRKHDDSSCTMSDSDSDLDSIDSLEANMQMFNGAKPAPEEYSMAPPALMRIDSSKFIRDAEDLSDLEIDFRGFSWENMANGQPQPQRAQPDLTPNIPEIVPVPSASPPSLPTSNLDISSIMTVLPSDMQQRFVDKLAETVGAQFASFFATSATSTAGAPTTNRAVQLTPATAPQSVNGPSFTSILPPISASAPVDSLYPSEPQALSHNTTNSPAASSSSSCQCDYCQKMDALHSQSHHLPTPNPLTGLQSPSKARPEDSLNKGSYAEFMNGGIPLTSITLTDSFFSNNIDITGNIANIPLAVAK